MFRRNAFHGLPALPLLVVSMACGRIGYDLGAGQALQAGAPTVWPETGGGAPAAAAGGDPAARGAPGSDAGSRQPTGVSGGSGGVGSTVTGGTSSVTIVAGAVGYGGRAGGGGTAGPEATGSVNGEGKAGDPGTAGAPSVAGSAGAAFEASAGRGGTVATAGVAGVSGAAGSGAAPPCVPLEPTLRTFSFDADATNWAANTEAPNTCSLAWVSTDGHDAPGALQAHMDLVDIDAFTAVQYRDAPLTGMADRIVVAHVLVQSGSDLTGKLYVQTTDYAWADSGSIALDPGVWTCLSLDMAHPAYQNAAYDPEKVITLGVRVRGAGNVTVLVDDVVY